MSDVQSLPKRRSDLKIRLRLHLVNRVWKVNFEIFEIYVALAVCEVQNCPTLEPRFFLSKAIRRGMVV